MLQQYKYWYSWRKATKKMSEKKHIPQFSTTVTICNPISVKKTKIQIQSIWCFWLVNLCITSTSYFLNYIFFNKHISLQKNKNKITSLRSCKIWSSNFWSFISFWKSFSWLIFSGSEDGHTDKSEVKTLSSGVLVNCSKGGNTSMGGAAIGTTILSTTYGTETNPTLETHILIH